MRTNDDIPDRIWDAAQNAITNAKITGSTGCTWAVTGTDSLSIKVERVSDHPSSWRIVDCYDGRTLKGSTYVGFVIAVPGTPDQFIHHRKAA